VVAVIQQAAAKARADMAEAMTPIRAGGDAARKAAAGVPDLSALRFDVPAVPHTAVDRSGNRIRGPAMPSRSNSPAGSRRGLGHQGKALVTYGVVLPSALDWVLQLIGINWPNIDEDQLRSSRPSCARSPPS